MLCICLKQKGILFTCCAGNEGSKVKDDLPCLRMGRVLGLQVVALSVPGIEENEQGQCLNCWIRKRKTSGMSFLLDFKGNKM